MYQVYLYQVYLKAFCQSALSDPQGSEALRCPEEDEARALLAYARAGTGDDLAHGLLDPRVAEQL